MDPSELRQARPFPETSWGLLARCCQVTDESPSAELCELLRRYWQPIYFFIYRHWGRNVDDAKDLTQAFFLKFLEKEFVRHADRDRGRFRNFVLGALTHFLQNEKRHAGAQKRRPHGGLLSLDQLVDDHRGFDVPAAEFEEDGAQFDRDWRDRTVALVLAQLRELACQLDKGPYVEMFVRINLRSADGARPSYQELARQQGASYHQVKNGLHWARGQFKRLFMRELRGQVGTAAELQEELAELYDIAF